MISALVIYTNRESAIFNFETCFLRWSLIKDVLTSIDNLWLSGWYSSGLDRANVKGLQCLKSRES